MALQIATSPADATVKVDPSGYQELESKIETLVAQNHGQIGVVYYDLTTGESISVHGGLLFNPASVIKVPVMVEVYKRVALGQLSLDNTRLSIKKKDRIWGSGQLYYEPLGKTYTIRQLVEVMITHSDNTATKMLIDYLGPRNINQTMRSLGLRNTIIGNSDLLNADGLNFSTPADMALLMRKLYAGEIFSPRFSQEMIQIMTRQTHKWGIPRFLPSNIRIANKTGSLTGIKNDVGIVYYNDEPYVLSIFTNMRSDEQAKLLLRTLSKEIFKWKTAEDNGVAP
ncbi:MAG: serine hydrolase [Candidatus Margulisiibacteriota bacterium]